LSSNGGLDETAPRADADLSASQGNEAVADLRAGRFEGAAVLTV
jgi:hypothetical protein